MDRIIKKSTIFSNKQHQETSPKEQVKSHSDVVREEKQESPLTRARDTFGKLTQRFQGGTDVTHDKPDPKSTAEEYKFKSGDRVVLQSIKERPITGTVRWVGLMRISRDPSVPQVIAVGVETVSLHNYIYIYCSTLYVYFIG